MSPLRHSAQWTTLLYALYKKEIKERNADIYEFFLIFFMCFIKNKTIFSENFIFYKIQI